MSADVGGRIKEQLNNKRRHKLRKETKERAAVTVDTMCFVVVVRFCEELDNMERSQN